MHGHAINNALDLSNQATDEPATHKQVHRYTYTCLCRYTFPEQVANKLMSSNCCKRICHVQSILHVSPRFTSKPLILRAALLNPMVAADDDSHWPPDAEKLEVVYNACVLAGFNATYLLTRLCGISLSHMLLQQTILANDISLFKVFVYPLVWIGFVTLVKLRTPWHWDTDAAWDGEDDGAGALVWIRVCVLFEFNLHCSNEMFATGGLFSDVQFSFWIHAGYIMTNSHVALAERCSQCCLLQRNKEIFLKKRNSWDFVQQIIVFF